MELITEVKQLQDKMELLKNSKAEEIKSQSQRILQDSNLMSFLKHSKHFILIVDENRNVIDINRVHKQLRKEDIIGNSIFSLITDESKEKSGWHKNRLLETRFATCSLLIYDGSRRIQSGKRYLQAP